MDRKLTAGHYGRGPAEICESCRVKMSEKLAKHRALASEDCDLLVDLKNACRSPKGLEG